MREREKKRERSVKIGNTLPSILTESVLPPFSYCQVKYFDEMQRFRVVRRFHEFHRVNIVSCRRGFAGERSSTWTRIVFLSAWKIQNGFLLRNQVWYIPASNGQTLERATSSVLKAFIESILVLNATRWRISNKQRKQFAYFPTMPFSIIMWRDISLVL